MREIDKTEIPIYLSIPNGCRILTGKRATGRAVVPLDLLPPTGAGTASNTSFITALTPVVVTTSTSSGRLNPALDGTMFTKPLASVSVLVWLTARITCDAELVVLVSPPPAGEVAAGRITVV